MSNRIQPQDSTEISLGALIPAIWTRKFLVAAITLLMGGLGAAYAFLATPVYSSSVTLQILALDSNRLNGLSAQLSSAAAFAGISIGGSAPEETEYLAILRSRSLAERFIERANLSPYLFPERWNEKAGEWRSAGDSGPPSPGEVIEAFDGMRTVTKDPQSGLIIVNFEFRDSELAANWANAFVGTADREIRHRTIAETRRNLNFLQTQVQRTSLAGVRQTMFHLIENQLERMMLLEAGDEYAYRIIDPARPAEKPSRPRRVLIIILSLLVGFALGVTVAVFVATLRGILRPVAADG